MYPRVYLKHLVADVAADENKLLATGQTTQYSSELDDGYYEKGTAKSYTILTAGDYSGTTNITVNAKTDVKSNNCVTDDKTSLMWSRYVSATVGPGDDGMMDWAGAADDIFAYCAAANAASLAGYADWRIPNIFELLSIANLEAPTGVPDPTAFPTWPSANFVWSSTTRASSTTFAFTVAFADGKMFDRLKTGGASAWWAALVRG